MKEFNLNLKTLLTLVQFWMAVDPILGSHSPLRLLFIKSPTSYKRSGVLLTTKWHTAVITLSPRQKCLPNPTLDSVTAASVLVSLCLVYLHSDCATLLHCIQVTWSHCGAESNVTGPGCSALPLPSKGPISAQGYHRTKSLGKRARGGQGVKEGKNVEIWVANL